MFVKDATRPFSLKNVNFYKLSKKKKRNLPYWGQWMRIGVKVLVELRLTHKAWREKPLTAASNTSTNPGLILSFVSSQR